MSGQVTKCRLKVKSAFLLCRGWKASHRITVYRQPKKAQFVTTYDGLITKPTRGCQVSWVRFLTQGFLLSSLSPRVLSAKRGFRWSFQLLFVHLGLIEATGSRSPIRPRVRSLRSTQLHECKGSTWCAAWRSELGWIFRSWLQPG